MLLATVKLVVNWALAILIGVGMAFPVKVAGAPEWGYVATAVTVAVIVFHDITGD